MIFLVKELSINDSKFYKAFLPDEYQFESNMIKYFTEKRIAEDFYISKFGEDILNFPCFILYI